jgi:autoinducer 2-degrading protein
MSKIILSGYIDIPEDKLEQITDALPEHINLTKEEVGCLVFEVSQDKNQLNRFHVYEEFIDQDAFDLHQLRVKNSSWGKISSDINRCYSIIKADD